MNNCNRTGWLLALSALALSCTNQNDTTPCAVVDRITAQADCYNPADGLTLTASGNGNATAGFEWSVYVQKDSSANGRLDNLKIKVGAPNQFTIADSVLKDNFQIDVTVATNCQGQLKYSPSTSFVRRITANNCTMWILKNQ